MSPAAWLYATYNNWCLCSTTTVERQTASVSTFSRLWKMDRGDSRQKTLEGRLVAKGNRGGLTRLPAYPYAAVPLSCSSATSTAADLSRLPSLP